jgi:hypothetical protein
VIIDGARGTSVPRPNIIRVNGANQVTVNGFTVRHYNSNGVFVVNVDGYKLTNLVATLGGVLQQAAHEARRLQVHLHPSRGRRDEDDHRRPPLG